MTSDWRERERASKREREYLTGSPILSHVFNQMKIYYSTLNFILFIKSCIKANDFLHLIKQNLIMSNTWYRYILVVLK